MEHYAPTAQITVPTKVALEIDGLGMINFMSEFGWTNKLSAEFLTWSTKEAMDKTFEFLKSLEFRPFENIAENELTLHDTQELYQGHLDTGAMENNLITALEKIEDGDDIQCLNFIFNQALSLRVIFRTWGIVEGADLEEEYNATRWMMKVEAKDPQQKIFIIENGEAAIESHQTVSLLGKFETFRELARSMGEYTVRMQHSTIEQTEEYMTSLALLRACLTADIDGYVAEMGTDVIYNAFGAPLIAEDSLLKVTLLSEDYMDHQLAAYVEGEPEDQAEDVERPMFTEDQSLATLLRGDE